MKWLQSFVLLSCFITSAVAVGESRGSVATPDRFPAAGTSYPIAGELVMVDHVNRTGILRCDRLDTRNKYHQDLPLAFGMLPYGTLYYHGAPATLSDILLGTHLHGWFHFGPAGDFEVDLLETDYAATVKNQPNDRSPDSPLSQTLRLEDDFTFYQRQRSGWEIVSIDDNKKQLVAERVDLDVGAALTELTGYPTVKGLTGKQTFDYTEATRVWQANQVAELSDVAVGQVILFNMTWATMYGPGRLTDIWLDADSRALATERQFRSFEQQMFDRGFPGMVTKIDYLDQGAGIVDIEFYSGFEPRHHEFFPINKSARLLVAESNLRTHDAHNDGKQVQVTEWIDVSQAESQSEPQSQSKLASQIKPQSQPKPEFQLTPESQLTPGGQVLPGSSGHGIRIRMPELLEGVRPGRTIRVQAGTWTRRGLPREEKIAPFNIRPQRIVLPDR
ncbi:hypothetical protein SAMN06265222_11549 [Neorhodopirellula lusitana]|uniref:Uncharacterized protein n=1 Tax=Neorhodopirellula lusitana TaxID=445327 RepID=A0ABY1QMG4_9BACT|nr:hypothetical protein [Neorhodopirellula lusitana]SMP72309.1 hypothetical protein SAMN06265222_11549 [Neorhodopirellula lusitana]